MPPSLRQKLSGLQEKIDESPKLSYWGQVYQRFSKLRLSQDAAAATFYLILSIFPLLIFIVSLSFSIDPRLWQESVDIVNKQNIIPEPIAEYLQTLVKEILDRPITPVLSLGFIGVLWAAGRAFSGLLFSFSQIYQVTILKSGILRRILGSGTLIILGIVLALLVSFLSFGDYIFGVITTSLNIKPFAFGYSVLGNILSFILVVIVFSLSFYFVSGRLGQRKDAFAGGLLTAILQIILSKLIGFFFNLTGRATIIFGSLTSIILFLLWIYFLCLFILYGAFAHRELVLYRVHKGTLSPDNLTKPLAKKLHLNEEPSDGKDEKHEETSSEEPAESPAESKESETSEESAEPEASVTSEELAESEASENLGDLEESAD